MSAVEVIAALLRFYDAEYKPGDGEEAAVTAAFCAFMRYEREMRAAVSVQGATA